MHVIISCTKLEFKAISSPFVCAGSLISVAIAV